MYDNIDTLTCAQAAVQSAAEVKFLFEQAAQILNGDRCGTLQKTARERGGLGYTLHSVVETLLLSRIVSKLKQLNVLFFPMWHLHLDLDHLAVRVSFLIVDGFGGLLCLYESVR